MFTIERRVAWLFRAAFKRCMARADQTAVQIRLSNDGLVMHASGSEIAVIYTQPNPTGKGVFTFPLAHFGEFEGKSADPVEINLLRPDRAGAKWTDKGRPRELEIPLVEPETVAKVPEWPKRFMPMPSHFLAALHDVCGTAADADTKYVLTKVQLRGKAGTIVGTDTRQMLVSGGFAFPFTEDLLIEGCRVFGLPPFQDSQDVGIGKTDTHLFIRVGDFTFAFLLDKQGRYPDVSQIIPRTSSTATKFKLHADDAQRFLDSLIRKIKGPGAKDQLVTLDLTDTPCLRFKMDDRVSEVSLVKSEVTGNRVRMSLNLTQFLHALELRFLEFEITDANKPMVGRDGDRIYITMPLSSESALPPSPDAFKVSTEPAPSKEMVPVRRRPRTPVVVSADVDLREPVNIFDILGEAEGLREGLFKVASHAGKILRFFRSVCTQQKLLDIARSSLFALGNQPAPGGK